jgi:hypothetical protein
MMSRVHSRGLSPEEGSPLRRVATTLRARSALAVPPGFGGLLRIDTARACCIPHPVVGFAKFQAHAAGPRKRSSRAGRPHWRHTLRSISLASSRTASPRPIPSRRSTGLARPSGRVAAPVEVCWLAADLKVLLHRRVRCMRTGVAASSLLDAPMGFDPVEGKSSRNCPDGPPETASEFRPATLRRTPQGIARQDRSSPPPTDLLRRGGRPVTDLRGWRSEESRSACRIEC